MKKLQIVSGIALIILIVVLLLAVAYDRFQKITPRQLGDSIFPLEETSKFCVNEKILDISFSDNKSVLIKTSKTLKSYNPDTGKIMWSVPIEEQISSFPPISASQRVFVSGKKYLWAFDLWTGELIWKTTLQSENTWVTDASTKFVLLNSLSDSVYVYDAVTGSKVWSIRVGRGYTKSYIAQNVVYIIDHGIKALDAFSGDLLWNINYDRDTGLSAMEDEVIYYLEYPGDNTFELVAYQTKIREEKWRISFVDNGAKDLYIHENWLLLADKKTLYKLNTEDGYLSWQRPFSDPTNISFLDNNVYVLEQFHRIIHAVDIDDGRDIGSLQISSPRIIGFEGQEMVSTKINLAFSRGCEVFIFR